MPTTTRKLSHIGPDHHPAMGTSSHPILPSPAPSSNAIMPTPSPTVGKVSAPKDSGTVFASTHTVAASSNAAIASLSAASLPSGRVVVGAAGTSTASHSDLAPAPRAHGSRSASPVRAYAQPPRTIVHLIRPASTTLIDHHAPTSPTRASSSSIVALKSASSGSRASLQNLSSTSSSLMSMGGGMSGIGTSSARGMPMSASVVSTFAIPMAPVEWLALSPEEARVYVKAVVKAAATDGAVQVPAGMVVHACDETGGVGRAKKSVWKKIKAAFRPHDDNDKQFMKSLKYPRTWIPRIYALFCLPPSAPPGPTAFPFPPPTPLLPTTSSTSNNAWLLEYLATTPAEDDPYLPRILPSNLPLHSTLWPHLIHTTRQIRLLRYLSRGQLASLWELTHLAKEETVLAMMIATTGDARRTCVQHVLEVARVLVVERGVAPAAVAGELVTHVFDAGLDRVAVGRLSAWMVRAVCGRQAAGVGVGGKAGGAVRRPTGGSAVGVRTGTAGSSCASDGAARVNVRAPVAAAQPTSSDNGGKHDTLPTQNLPHMTDPRFASTSTPDVNDHPAPPPVTQRASNVDLVERSCQMIDLTQLGSDTVQSPTDTLHDSGACVGERYRNTISVANARLASHKSGHIGETVAKGGEVQDGVEWKRRGTAPVMTKVVSRRASEVE